MVKVILQIIKGKNYAIDGILEFQSKVICVKKYNG